MKTLSSASIRTLLPLMGMGVVGLAACKSDSEADAATVDGTVTWTHNGTTYTSTARASAIVDPSDKIIITGGSNDGNNIVSLVLNGINAHGAGVYDLRRGSVLDDLPTCIITLNGRHASQGSMFSTLYGPAARNGTLRVTEYDRTGQRLSGTFSFTAGVIPNTPGTGIQAILDGSFSFTRFR